jgi:glycolate oxidase iron-sulfur subunit
VPCTQQHALRAPSSVPRALSESGNSLCEVRDAHLCCGSAGTYSILQPGLARQLRANKLDALEAGQPEVIATANIGCLLHLRQGTDTPVRHWIELIDEGDLRRPSTTEVRGSATR